MKQIETRNSKRPVLLIAGWLMIILFLTSCAVRKSAFLPSTVVPAAEGDVKIKKDANNNYAIKIDVTNLAEPQKLNPKRNEYVVWIETAEHGVKNIGQIITSSAILSKKLKASFETVSSFYPVKVFITAEDDAKLQYPTGVTVLSTNNF